MNEKGLPLFCICWILNHSLLKKQNNPPLPSQVIVKHDAMAEGALNQQFTNWLVIRIMEDLSQSRVQIWGLPWWPSGLSLPVQGRRLNPWSGS